MSGVATAIASRQNDEIEAARRAADENPPVGQASSCLSRQIRKLEAYATVPRHLPLAYPAAAGSDFMEYLEASFRDLSGLDRGSVLRPTAKPPP